MKNIIITIHGIKWKGRKDWQNQFGAFVKKEDPDISVFHFRYGYLFAFASWFIRLAKFLRIPFIQGRYARRLAKFIKKIQGKYPGHRISIIAHSFGGHIVEQAVALDEGVKLENIVFVHCPISAHIEMTSMWNWLEFGRVKAIHAWSSHKDAVIGKIAIKPFGQNGYWGFIRYDRTEDRKRPAEKPYPIELYNVHTEERHSGVLDDLTKYGRKLVGQLCETNKTIDLAVKQ